MTKHTYRTVIQIISVSFLMILITVSSSKAMLLQNDINGIRTLDWSPDGKLLAVGRDDGTVEVVNTATNQIIESFETSSGIVNDVAWHPTDPNKLAIASGYGIVRIINITTPEGWIFPDSGELVDSISWSPDGTKLAGAVRCTPPDFPLHVVLIWDAATGSVLSELTGHTDALSTIAWSPDGNRIISGSADTTAIIWDTATDTPLITLEPFEGLITAVTWSPDSSQVATASLDGDEFAQSEIQIWDSLSGELLAAYTNEYVLDINWSPVGNQLAIADGNTMQILDIATGRIVETVQQLGRVNSLAWSPDGNKLAYGGVDDGILEVISIPTSPTTPTVTLRSIFNPPSCAASCYIGIIPGQTSRSEFETILDQHDIAYLKDPAGQTDRLIFYSFAPSEDETLIYNEPNGIVVDVTHVVEEVTIQLTGVTVSDVLSAYGAPSAITNRGGNLLVYPEYGLVFLVSPDETHVYIVFIIPAGFDSRRLSLYLDSGTCSGSAAICGIPTATPTVTTTLTPTPATPTLLELLSAPSCSIACFLGIEPGMTTQVDLESILSGLNIQYDVSPIGLEGNTFDYSFNPHNNWPYVGNNQRSIGILVGDGIVFQMIVPLADVPIDTILDQYGPPDGIVGPSENRLLLYASYGLAFFVSRTDSTVVTSAWFSTQDGIVYAFVDNPNYPDVQPCTQPANLCAIETSTPSPSAVETGTP